MIINLSDNQKKAMKEAIHAYYLDERGEDIGILHQEGLFDLFMEQLAPIVYNAALDDAKYWYSRRMDDVEDIGACADILCSVYNNELWMCRWDKETAVEYLKDFFENKKFVGYVAEEEGEVIAGIFAHEKVWWNSSEVFVEEMFVTPEKQGNGIFFWGRRSTCIQSANKSL